jgi:ribosomal protein S18 acetylase RimI-like enzyme
MPRCSDPQRLRTVLTTDPAWALYLLGDLEPARFSRGEWWCNDEAVALLYRGFDRPVLLACGPPEAVEPLFEAMPPEPLVYLHLLPEVVALVERRYAVPEPKPMLRMALVRERFRPAAFPGAVRATAADAEGIAALYRDGESAGESPGFFAPDMVEQELYAGVREGGEWIAVAGTHLLSPRESVAAIGNVYTRRDRRGRGLGAITTSAVTAELVASGVRTVALSVAVHNATAVRLYERLGFATHCRFVEGVATLR